MYFHYIMNDISIHNIIISIIFRIIIIYSVFFSILGSLDYPLVN